MLVVVVVAFWLEGLSVARVVGRVMVVCVSFVFGFGFGLCLIFLVYRLLVRCIPAITMHHPHRFRHRRCTFPPPRSNYTPTRTTTITTTVGIEDDIVHNAGTVLLRSAWQEPLVRSGSGEYSRLGASGDARGWSESSGSVFRRVLQGVLGGGQDDFRDEKVVDVGNGDSVAWDGDRRMGGGVDEYAESR